MYDTNKLAYTSLCGVDCNLSYIGTLQVVQDCICEYLTTLGADQITLKTQHNCVWVFMKNKIKFFAPISWNEHYKTSCFISFKSSAKIIVDVAFYTKKGALATYSRTEMCLVDLTLFKIRRITNEILHDDTEVQNPVISLDFVKFQPIEKVEKNSCKVESTCIDYVGHCNNIEYVRFILNTYSGVELRTLRIDTLEISYINQALEGEGIDIFASKTDKRHFFELSTSDKIVLKCAICLK